MTISPEAITSALADLGDDPAAKLAELGVKGVRNDCHRCPLAAYLAGRFLIGAGRVTVWRNSVNIDAEIDDDEEVPSIPHSLCDFIDRFDAGQYPELGAAR